MFFWLLLNRYIRRLSTFALMERPDTLGHRHYAATACASTDIFTVSAVSGAVSEVGERRSCHSVRCSSASASANGTYFGGGSRLGPITGPDG